jgi:hydrogenase maturation protein HypF
VPPAAGPTRDDGERQERYRLRVTGTVQGVGFRPFVYRHAVALGLRGFVRNDSAGVLIEVEGPIAAVETLQRVLIEQPPPLARVDDVSLCALGPIAGASPDCVPAFVIAASEVDGAADVPVSVDTAPCAACLAEVDDPADRRYRYPFTNCTDCGPRYTIIQAVPYDRPATTMAGFTMCGNCQREYDDPLDRRFHAQPNACPACGPHVSLVGADRDLLVEGDHGLREAARLLLAGAILAIKGVGGYHLAVDATNAASVAELRRRKARDEKPFAVMVADLAQAARLVHLPAAVADLLTSPRRPIVLALRHPNPQGPPVAEGVAPGVAELGLMLPYSPLHHLLLAEVRRPLVMTSGNRSDEPIAYTDDDAAERLGPLVDALLVHNRPIHIRCDDSVVRGRDNLIQVLRRSRGFAPEPLTLPQPAGRQLLCVGAELKSTVAVAKGRMVVASHHLGDLEHLDTYRAFLQAVDHLCGLYGVAPSAVVHDLHPEYLSTKFAHEMDLPSIGVQHHHAHVASCLVDHHRSGPVLAVAFDGLGYGPDGTLWGGELLAADLREARRVGHLVPVALPGGPAAIREPWRMAVAWVRQSLGHAAAAVVGRRLDPRADDLLALLEAGSAPTTTSAGRLFDAVAALALGRSISTYEGQAAMALEACSTPVAPGAVAPYPITVTCDGAGEILLDPATLIAAVVDDVDRSRAGAEIAAAFHDGLAAALGEALGIATRVSGLGTVALTGGVFQNARLTHTLVTSLSEQGFEVLVHREVPPNDGGISIGQAAVGAALTS